MKRIAVFLAVIMLLSLCACREIEEPQPSPDPVTEEPADPDPDISPEPASAPPETASPATSEPDPTPTASAPPEADCSLNIEGEELPAYLFSGDLKGGEESNFTCILPIEAVSAAYEHNAWVFRTEENSEAFLELSFITGGDVEDLLPGLLDSYLDFEEIEFSEATSLGQMRGDVGRVSARNADVQAEGWLMNAGGGAIAAVLIYPQGAAEEEVLRAVLNSFMGSGL